MAIKLQGTLCTKDSYRGETTNHSFKNNHILRCITHQFFNYFGALVAMCNVIIILNFITKWDREQQQEPSVDPSNQPSYQMSVHTMFRDVLIEPTEDELMLASGSQTHMRHLRL